MQAESYRSSHTQVDYGKKYETSYDSRTFYGQLWDTIEKKLLVFQNSKTQKQTGRKTISTLLAVLVESSKSENKSLKQPWVSMCLNRCWKSLVRNALN